MSNGTPTTAASSWSAELVAGNRMNVAMPPNRGISLPPSGWGKAGVVMAGTVPRRPNGSLRPNPVSRSCVQCSTKRKAKRDGRPAMKNHGFDLPHRQIVASKSPTPGERTRTARSPGWLEPYDASAAERSTMIP